ncbi:MAG: DUF368 domain-containing protein [Clostridia bacterium]|nr:DUF368 domain-containing protein [Clostridia bacterium]
MAIEPGNGPGKNNIWTLGMRVLQGAMVGAGAILPGISGGVLCVVFGIYEPMMALLSHPMRAVKKYYKLFVPIIIGVAIGFVLLARLVELLFASTSSATLALFVGLISGTLPQLFRDSARNAAEENKGWSGFALALALTFGILLYLKNGAMAQIQPGIGWYAFCGAIWGLSVVVPGLSSSSILIFMGLYQPMTAGIAALDMGVILPLVCGLILSVLLSARFVNYLLDKHHTRMSRCILGIVIASTLLIVPAGYADLWDAAASLAAFGAGFAIAWGMDKCKDKMNID